MNNFLKHQIFLLLVGIGLCFALPGDYKHFSNTMVYTDALSWQNGFWIASEGGVRRIDQVRGIDKIYTTLEGLPALSQAALVQGGNGALYAIAKNGAISRYSAKKDRFETENVSFRSLGESLYQNRVIAKGSYLVLAMAKRVSFYNTQFKSFDLSISRIGSNDLVNTPVIDLKISTDTLFVAFKSAIYFRKIDFTDVRNNPDLPDPGTWQKYPGSDTLGVINSFVKQSSVKTDSAFGFADDKNTRIMMGTSEILVVRGDTIKEPFAYIFDSEGNSASNCFDLLLVSGTDWIVCTERLLVKQDTAWIVYLPNSPFPFRSPFQIVLNQEGAPLTWSGDVVSVYKDGFWMGGFFPFAPSPWEVAPHINQPLKSMYVDSRNNLVAGTWGGGVYWKPSGGDPYRLSEGFSSFNAGQQGCIEPYIGASFSLVPSVIGHSDFPGSFMTWWGNPAVNHSYGIAYITEYGQMICLPNKGSVSESGIAAFMQIDDKSYLYVAHGSGNEGVDRFEFGGDPASNGNFIFTSRIVINYQNFGNFRDMVADRWGRLWVIGVGAMGYFDQFRSSEQKDSLIVMNTKLGIGGGPFTSLEIDRDHTLWISTLGSGVYSVDLNEKEPEINAVQNYRVRDGMMTDRIYDIAIQKKSGEIWMAHENGVSRYESFSRDSRDFMKNPSRPLLIYPQPFRPGVHSNLIMENLADNAKVKIWGSDGNPIAAFGSEDTKGGVLRWNGKSGSGGFVTPGLYYFLVQSKAGVVRGKIIVLR